MRGKEIIRAVSKKVNQDSPHKSDDYITMEIIERVLSGFKEVVMDCIQKAIPFHYTGFFEVETTELKTRERADPRTQDKIIKRRGYKAKIRFTPSVKKWVESIEFRTEDYYERLAQEEKEAKKRTRKKKS